MGVARWIARYQEPSPKMLHALLTAVKGRLEAYNWHQQLLPNDQRRQGDEGYAHYLKILQLTLDILRFGDC